MTRYQLSSIFLLLLVQYVQFISTTDNVYSVVRANGIRTRSISAEAIEKSTERQSVTFIDESILSALNDALYIINTPECAKDFNATIIGIQQHEPWAVASKYWFLNVKYVCVPCAAVVIWIGGARYSLAHGFNFVVCCILKSIEM